MDMYQKRKMRAEKKQNNNQESFHKSSLSWYPGHMAKTKRQIIEDLKLIDVVVEILDARIPLSSRNPDIKEITKDKTKLIVLNKCDLADENENKKWVEYYKSKGILAMPVNSVSGKGINEVLNKITQIYNDEKYIEKGRIGKSIRIMVLGIPNVGKSSFINRITKKNTAQVGNKPGVTKQKQWIRVSDQIELLDTPGVLWPKFESEEVSLNLAYTGNIKDDILDITNIGYELLKLMINNYLPNIEERYKIEDTKITEILKLESIEENEKIIGIMELIGQKRGVVVSGGNIDYERVAKIIIEDFRSGKFGRITLETTEKREK